MKIKIATMSIIIEWYYHTKHIHMYKRWQHLESVCIWFSRERGKEHQKVGQVLENEVKRSLLLKQDRINYEREKQSQNEWIL